MKSQQQTPTKPQDPTKDNRITNEDNRVTNIDPKESVLPGSGKQAPAKEDVDPEIELPQTKPTTTEEERPTMGGKA